MLSGFVFEIDSMPFFIQVVTYFIPARYFVSSLQTLFLAGDIPMILMLDMWLLIVSAIFLLA